ncbi:MAG: translocase of outer mitochondrial membrane [Vezdaea aestivalis]|nr:MAG: translocase of outer mitochondrial membrane [Vezdaea aestivalis]
MDEKSSATGFLTDNAFANYISSKYQAFKDRRDSLGLSNPGTTDNHSKEVTRDVFLTNMAFTGMRADMTTALSMVPMFQLSHNIAMGTQGMPPYTFSTLYGNNKAFLQGNLDNEFQLSARAHYRWTSALVTKTQANLAPGGQSMVQIDNDYTGKDFSASLKSISPSLLQGGITGIFIGSYMQSLTPRLSLGLEGVWQRAAMNLGPEAALSYFARYKANDWIATANLQPQGALNTTYWRRLSDKVQAGVDMSVQMVGATGQDPGMFGSGLQKEAVTTIGAKYDFRASTLRVQVDTNSWKLGCLVEKRVLPTVQLVFSGEMDHSKNTAKLGFALSLESASEELMEQQEQQEDTTQSIPF